MEDQTLITDNVRPGINKPGNNVELERWAVKMSVIITVGLPLAGLPILTLKPADIAGIYQPVTQQPILIV